ncbi:MAG: Na+/H+ antiporter NhaC [Crocinitomicaceae bacterium]|nr:Na+/H+ antiporter NhaC [Crocinitomicaceae bacterium]
MSNKTKSPSFFIALIPILILVGLLAVNVMIFGDNATYGPNQIALIVGTGVAAVIGIRLSFTWKKLEKGIVKSIKTALPAILILLMIGALAGTWMISGIVPTMIYYGLEIIHPSIFLVAACIVSAIVAMATGSSWSTIATVGLALIGIGEALGFHLPMVAGAIISGAYFGDKMSPLSDTTNLAPAMAGTDLFTHIRYMALTTIPSIILTLIIFLILGFTVETSTNSASVNTIVDTIEGNFYISPILMLVPIIVIALIVKKVSAVPALLIGSLLGAIAAVLFQPDIITRIAGESSSYALAAYTTSVQAMFGGISILEEGHSMERLLSTGGMEGMMNTIWLIICAMAFGGVMEACGLLQKITRSVVKLAKSTGSLIATTAGTCVFFNATASDQYLAIVVPGRMFADTYEERDLAPQNLSRTLEDSGTVTSVLFPWNTCGAAQSSILHVATGEYWMYCFFNLISPLMTITFGYLNVKIAKIKSK